MMCETNARAFLDALLPPTGPRFNRRFRSDLAAAPAEPTCGIQPQSVLCIHSGPVQL